MSIQRAFAPYEGDEPYVFISYAHADAQEVLPIAAALHDRGYRVWYDEGIEAGSEWPESIALHLCARRWCFALSPTPMFTRTTAGGRCTSL